MTEVKRLDLGAVSAYALAVEKGYEGTEEEFVEILTNALNYATQAQGSASAAAGSAEEAGRYKTQAEKILADVNSSGTQQIEAIEAAGTQQTNTAKEAIEAKGKETLDSIPDSYETLQGDVTQLRGDLGDCEKSIFSTSVDITMIFTNGDYPNTDGSIGASTNYSGARVTVNEGEIYIVNGWSFWEVALYALLDVDGNVLDYYPKESKKQVEYTDFKIRIPSNCTTLLIGKRGSAQYIEYIPTLKKLIDNIYENNTKTDALSKEVDNAKSSLSGIKKQIGDSNFISEIKTPVSVSYNSNTFVDTRGYFTTNSNYCAGSIPVSEGEIYKIDGWSFYEVALYGLLDADGNLIDYYPKESKKPVEYTDLEITIPSGCVTLMIGKRSSIQATTYIPTVYKVYYENKFENIEKGFIPLKQGFDALSIPYSDFKNIVTSATITLIDDDGYPAYVPAVKDICDNLGIKCTFACNTGKWTSDDVISLFKGYQNEGFHITSHSHSHSSKWGWKQATTNEDKNTLYYDMLHSYEIMEKNGFLDYRMFVVPSGGYDSVVTEIVKEWSDCLVTTLENANSGFSNRYRLNRVFINLNTGSHDLSYYTGLIDEAIETGSWLIFGTHSGDVDWGGNDFDEALVSNVLQYAVNHGVEILPLNSAFKKLKKYYELYELMN